MDIRRFATSHAMLTIAFVYRVSTLATFAVAAVAMSLPLPSLAAEASLSFSNITLSAEDNDPTDGIEAGFSFVEGGSGTAGFVEALGVIESFGTIGNIDNPFITTSASLSGPGTSVSGVTTPSSIALAGSASGPGSFQAHYGLAAQIVGTPNSSLVIDFVYGGKLDIVNACGSVNCEFASMSYALYVSDIQVLDQYSAAYVVDDDRVFGTGSFKQHITFKAELDPNEPIVLRFRANVLGLGADSGGGTPPIPEPETYALMLLGLGALGIVSRRRDRR